MNTLSLLNLNQISSWSQPFAYDKNSCFICQPPGVPLHKLPSTQTGESMHNLAQKLTDEELLIHLNSFPNAADAVASNVQYYLKCWVELLSEVYCDYMAIYSLIQLKIRSTISAT